MTILSFMLLLPPLCKGQDIRTPLERDNYSKLSGYTEMMEYLEELNSRSSIVTVSTIGKSVQGREIPALYFSLDGDFGSKRATKVLVLIFCQQHGDEPSGKEAALIVARDLMGNGRGVLQNLDLILVPQVNPDGAEMGQRKNANDMDLNRNHAILSEPESYALHRLFLEWMPEVTLDVHEYDAIKEEWVSHGFVKDAEEMMGGVTNLNIAPSLMDFSRETLIPEVGQQIQRDGFSFHRYIVGTPFENDRIRYSTTAINDGRQSMGIYNTLSFILEGKQYGDLTTNAERRTEGQVSALVAFLRTVGKHRKEILRKVRSAREELQDDSQHGNSYVHLQMDYFPDPDQKTLTFPVFDLHSWRRIEKVLENYEPIVRIKKSVRRPYAYVFSPKEEKLLDLLFKHQIEMHRLKTDVEAQIQAYSILHVTPTLEEDKDALYVDVEVRREMKLMEKGSIVILLDQKAVNLIPLLLEPQSSWSVATPNTGRKYRFADYLTEGSQYPILRLVKSPQLNMEPFQEE